MKLLLASLLYSLIEVRSAFGLFAFVCDRQTSCLLSHAEPQLRSTGSTLQSHTRLFQGATGRLLCVADSSDAGRLKSQCSSSIFNRTLDGETHTDKETQGFLPPLGLIRSVSVSVPFSQTPPCGTSFNEEKGLVVLSRSYHRLIMVAFELGYD